MSLRNPDREELMMALSLTSIILGANNLLLSGITVLNTVAVLAGAAGAALAERWREK